MDLHSIGVSVVICCHNSVPRLHRTLEHLAAQSVPPNLSWEVVLVDNLSTDDTADVARQLWPVGAPAPLRVVHEPRAGLAFARIRGLIEARYELLAFVDDDNWVAENWVAMVALVANEYPEAGIFGSKSSVAMDAPCPSWFNQCQNMYGVSLSEWRSRDVDTVWGAGMVVRKSAWENLLRRDSPQLLSGRLKNSMAGGEDTELCLQFRLAGWRLRYDCRLQIKHYMPADRLSWRYARRLHYGAGESSVALSPYRAVLSGTSKRESSWLGQVLMVIKVMAAQPISLVTMIIGHGQGDFRILGLEIARGRLSALLAGWRDYNQNRKLVREFALTVRRQGHRQELQAMTLEAQ